MIYFEEEIHIYYIFYNLSDLEPPMLRTSHLLLQELGSYNYISTPMFISFSLCREPIIYDLCSIICMGVGGGRKSMKCVPPPISVYNLEPSILLIICPSPPFL